jgi:hypothetical protein
LTLDGKISIGDAWSYKINSKDRLAIVLRDFAKDESKENSKPGNR